MKLFFQLDDLLVGERDSRPLGIAAQFSAQLRFCFVIVVRFPGMEGRRRII
jgi:hypothetical protein